MMSRASHLSAKGFATVALAAIASAIGACGGGSVDAPARNDLRRQQPPMQQTAEPPPSIPRDMPGKGRGSETKWNRQINH